MASAMYRHDGFQSTTHEGLRQNLFPMRLYHKAKKLGTWDPCSLDFGKDQEDWKKFSPEEQETFIRLCSLFVAGEESVTRDLLPLMMVISQEGRVEEEMFLTTFLWEEAKHTEFFRRFLDEVVKDTSDLSRFHSPHYRTVFYEELPKAMFALLSDPSPEAMARAAVTYHMIVEGVLAETGYQAFFDVIEARNVTPGLKEGIGLLKRDESRHIAWGVYLLSRLIAEHPSVWDVIQERMGELWPHAIGVVNELFEGKPTNALGQSLDDFIHYAQEQFATRMDRIELARNKSLSSIEQVLEEGV